MPDQWMTPKEAGEVLRVSAWTIRKLVREGRLEGLKLGHRTVRVRMVEEQEAGDGVQGQAEEVTGKI